MKHSADANALETAGFAGDDSRLVEALRDLKGQRSPRRSRAAKAMQILAHTSSSRVRNAAALALADLRDGSAKDALIDLLTRPDTKGSRGTLLYALEQLGAEVPLPILADIIAEEPYEAREEALALIARSRSEGSPVEMARARARLEAARASADAERSQAIGRALEYLRKTHC
jgi:HEAT repeat protein